MAPIEPLYGAISTEEDHPCEHEEDHDRKPKSKCPKIFTIVFSITTLIFGLQALRMSLRPEVQCIGHRFGEGYETEWAPAKASIEMQKVTYTSAFRYNATSKTYYRESDSSQPQYVGTPTPEIDKAWEELLAGQYLVLSQEEALQLDDPVPINGYYFVDVEVMHSLHCLNAIRKALYREYYSVHEEHPLPEELRLIHVEHCLDQLRQNIQCAGDLTPVPLKPFGEEPNVNLIGTPQVHTCRNWDTFRKWYMLRGEMYGRIEGGGT